MNGCRIRTVHYQQQEVSIDERAAHGFHHAFMQFILGVQHSGGIAINDLIVVAVENPHNAVAGGLCFGRDNAELFAEQRIHEG